MFLKKTGIVICGLIMGHVYANQISSEHNQWIVGGRGLYLQPSNGSGASLTLGKSDVEQTTVLGAEPNWSWGFNVELGYQNSIGNDVYLNWSHFRESVNSYPSNFSVNNIYILQSYFTDAGVYQNFSVSNSSFNVNPAWDQVNLEFAKQLHLGAIDKMRVHAGVNYSRVANTGGYQFLYAYTDTSNRSETNQFNDSFSASYNGFGPRLGTDLAHLLSNGYIVYGELAGSVLAGMTKATRTYNNMINMSGTSIPYNGLAAISRPRVVPELDARLGVKFEYFRPSGHLVADIGWLWVNYFGALTCNEQNFGIQGLVVGLKWKAYKN